MNFNDVCTFWIERLGPWDWTACCVRHDADYAALVAKAIADARLEACVNAVLPGMGSIMFIGVSVFGGLWYARAVARHFSGANQRPS